MASLFSALTTAANSISVYEDALTLSSNNIANAETPGYAEQNPTLVTLQSDPATGLNGGVLFGPVESSRDLYAETAVQQASTQLGTWEQQLSALQGLQGDFDTTGSAGIPGALNQLFTAFSNWSANPTDPTAQQGVIEGAQGLAQAFQAQFQEVNQAASTADTQLSGLVNQVNTLTAKIAQDNEQDANGTDAGADADLYNNLQQLAQLVPITTLKQADGTTTVLLNGQTALVVGANQYQISAQVSVPSNPPPTNPGGLPTDQVLDSNGNDITAEITGGQIGGLLQARNGVLAQLQGDAYQQGSLNQLAQGIADQINSLLTSGNISDADPTTNTPAVPGIALFSYDSSSNAAQTLAVNPNITSSQLAAIDPGPPEVDNGIALALANLATPASNGQGEIDNMSYAEFYGNMAGQVGSAISNAQSNQSTSQNQVTQATNQRQQASGVDLNSEAIRVLQFQQAYNAAAKMVSVVDTLVETILDAINPVVTS